MGTTVKRLIAVIMALLLLQGFAVCFAASANHEIPSYPEEFYWDKAGEDADNGYKGYNVKFGAPLEIPDDPVREGCRFMGWKDWYTDEFVDLTQETMDSENGRRFYAVWEKNTYYTSIFYVNGKVHATIENICGEAFIVPRSPQIDGYTFTGWNPKLPQTTPAENLTFYAQFEPNAYTATLLVDGEVYKEIPYTYGQKSIDLPDVPKKDGYTGVWESYSLGIGGVTINAIYTPVSRRVLSVKLDDMTLHYKERASLPRHIEAQDGAVYSVSFISSDESTVKVDSDGNVTGVQKGTATVTMTVTELNGNSFQTSCRVTVKYSWYQWIVQILFFGWLWGY